MFFVAREMNRSKKTRAEKRPKLFWSAGGFGGGLNLSGNHNKSQRNSEEASRWPIEKHLTISTPLKITRKSEL